MSANKKRLDRYVERYNAGDLDGVMDLYADDVVRVGTDGKIVLNTLYFDNLALAAQIGS